MNYFGVPPLDGTLGSASDLVATTLPNVLLKCVNEIVCKGRLLQFTPVSGFAKEREAGFATLEILFWVLQ